MTKLLPFEDDARRVVAENAALKARVAELEGALELIVTACADFRAAVIERGYNDSTITERDAMLRAIHAARAVLAKGGQNA